MYGNTSIVSTQSPYTPVDTDTFLFVDTTGGAVTIDLPAASGRTGPIRVKDIKGDAATNNITITPNGTDTIDGLSSLVINSNYGGYFLYPVSGGWTLSP